MVVSETLRVTTTDAVFGRLSRSKEVIGIIDEIHHHVSMDHCHHASIFLPGNGCILPRSDASVHDTHS